MARHRDQCPQPDSGRPLGLDPGRWILIVGALPATRGSVWA